MFGTPLLQFGVLLALNPEAAEKTFLYWGIVGAACIVGTIYSFLYRHDIKLAAYPDRFELPDRRGRQHTLAYSDVKRIYHPFSGRDLEPGQLLITLETSVGKMTLYGNKRSYLLCKLIADRARLSPVKT